MTADLITTIAVALPLAAELGVLIAELAPGFSRAAADALMARRASAVAARI